MVLIISCCWFCITASLFFFIRFITMRVFRIKGEDSSQKDNLSHKDNSSFLWTKELRSLDSVPEATGFEETDYDACREKETSSFDFKFRFQFPEYDIRSKDEEESSTGMDNSASMTTNISKYRFLSEKDFSCFMEEPETMTVCVQESHVDSNGDFSNDAEMLDRELKTRFLKLKDLRQFNSSVGVVHEEEVPNHISTGVFSTADKPEDSESIISFKDQLSTKERLQDSEISFLGNRDATYGVCPLTGKDCFEFDSDSDSTSVSDGYSVKTLIIDSDSDGFLSERDFGTFKHKSETTKSTFMYLDGENAQLFDGTQKSEEKHLKNSIGISMDFNKENLEFLEEIRKSKKAHLKNLCTSYTKSLNSTDGSSHLKDPMNYSNLCGFSQPEGELEQFHEQETVYKDTHLQDTCISNAECINLETQIYSSSVKKPNSSSNHLNKDFHEEDAHEPECIAEYLDGEETESIEVGKFTETQSPNSFNLDNGSFEVGNDGISSFKQNSKLSQFDQVLAEKGLQEPRLKPKDSGEEETEEMADSRKSEDIHMRISQIPNDFLCPINGSQQNDAILFGKDLEELEQSSEVFSGKETEPQKDQQRSEENHVNKSSYLDMEDSDELESLWEHQDLIEQLKMEIKKVRAIGLPTILEESESPKMIEDLKPFKIDTKFLHENPIDELHKFYKSYRERMRKFDILNYQKMYAIGFLQLKDPLQSMDFQKPLIPTITSLLSQSFWSCRRRKVNTDPSEKFIKELQNDLEIVYVGQSCLSWEFLRWQYEKARELPESDLYGSRQYNQVAGEFQQFQVIMQRFLENEPFQGPRVPNYVKNRCVLRNLLQVPVIKEDCLKDKMEERRKGNGAISIEVLEDIMEESIGVFWEFVKADKDETPMIVKGLMRTQVELQDPTDFEIVANLQANLQKKEKKLKDLLRTGNCLVKKFKKPQEDRSNQDLFFSQVDLKLVSRVLKMSRLTTDQLVWCHKKLNKITFVERKLHREPSFLLFPC